MPKHPRIKNRRERVSQEQEQAAYPNNRTKVAKPMQVIRAWLPNMSLETCVIGYKRRPKKGHESS